MCGIGSVQYCIWLSMCERNVVETAQHIKYAFVQVCHEMREDLMGSGCIYCIHVLCGCVYECMNFAQSKQGLWNLPGQNGEKHCYECCTFDCA